MNNLIHASSYVKHRAQISFGTASKRQAHMLLTWEMATYQKFYYFLKLKSKITNMGWWGLLLNGGLSWVYRLH